MLCRGKKRLRQGRDSRLADEFKSDESDDGAGDDGWEHALEDTRWRKESAISSNAHTAQVPSR